MQSDNKSTQKPNLLRTVVFNSSKSSLRRLLRNRLKGLLGKISRTFPEVEDFDDVDVASDELQVVREDVIYERYEGGLLQERFLLRRRKLVIPIFIIISLISTAAYFLLN